MSYRCLIMAGGTGGHIFPALAVAECLEQRGFEIDWLGSHHGLETQLVPQKYRLHKLPIKGLRRASIIAKCLLPWRLLRSVYAALRIIYRIKPDVVLGMGGYVAAPGGIAARLAGKKLIIHEQNAKAGLTNRYLAKIAHQRLQAFPDALPAAMTVGNPVRSSLLTVASCPPEKRLRLLVLGGSQGARPINIALQKCLLDYPDLTQQLQVWHQSGEADYPCLKSCYEEAGLSVDLDAFIQDMPQAYAWANLVICRAGAMTVSEISAVGIASILVPYPLAADNHQYFNALSLSQKKAAVLLPQSEMTATVLRDLLERFIKDRESLVNMGAMARKNCHGDSTAIIADQCCRYLT